MKKYLLIFLLADCQKSNAQSQEKIIIEKVEWVNLKTFSGPFVKGPQYIVILSNGDTIVWKSALKLGHGTLPNGDFNYIATPSNSMEAKLKKSTQLKEIRVTSIVKKGSEKFGYKYIIQAEGHYLIQLEDAIAAGEIIVPDQFRPKKTSNVVVVHQPVSAADELTKLNKLYKDSVITKDEYEAQKKKLLAK